MQCNMSESNLRKVKGIILVLPFFKVTWKWDFFVAAWSIPFPFENFGENGIIVIGFQGSYCVKQFQTLKSIQLATGHTFPISTTLSILRSVEVLCVMLNVNRLLPKVFPHLLCLNILKLFCSTGLEMTTWTDPISSPGRLRTRDDNAQS